MAIITISREYGSGAQILAQKLADRLGYTLLEKELVAQVAEDLNISKSEATLLEKESGSRLLRFLDMYTSHTVQKVVNRSYGRLDDRSYYDATSKLVMKVADSGNVILIGWGAQCILQKHPQTLHLRMVKEVADRAVHVRKNNPKLDQRAAQELIEREDREKASYIEHYFNRSIDDPHLYHMVLNLSRLSESDAIQIILDYVQSHFHD